MPEIEYSDDMAAELMKLVARMLLAEDGDEQTRLMNEVWLFRQEEVSKEFFLRKVVQTMTRLLHEWSSAVPAFESLLTQLAEHQIQTLSERGK